MHTDFLEPGLSRIFDSETRGNPRINCKALSVMCFVVIVCENKSRGTNNHVRKFMLWKISEEFAVQRKTNLKID